MIDISKAGTFTLARSNSAPVISASVSSPIGPRLTTWALQQVVSFLGYNGRAANVAATAESDPSGVYQPVGDAGLYSPSSA